jgi:hypothetical protein
MGKHGPSIVVEFGGRKFRRYPESPARHLRSYFHAQRGYSLHRAIWESVHGPQPAGMHVHHVDGDPLNNDIANLQLVSAAEHMREHASEPERVEKALKNIARARAAAPAWHRSEAGRAWHVEHGRRVFAGREPVQLVCKVCRTSFASLQPWALVCSRKCSAKDRRQSGLDDADFTCAECGGSFRRSRFKPAKYCSQPCCKRARHRASGAGL